MDFLDPKKSRAEEIRRQVGYVLVGIAILLGTVVALYLAYGYSLHKGKIIQNGLVFVSSHPTGSDIILGGAQTATTPARLTLPAATYTMKIKRDGYRTWVRAITIDGDSVERFDYPFLFPKSLTTKTLATLSTSPVQATQSPNRRWLLLESGTTLGSFELYDLNNPAKAPLAVAIPSNLLTSPTTTRPQSLSMVEWSDDNTHVLLKHTYDKTFEYILLDTQSLAKSLNLNKVLNTDPTLLTLQNKKYDHYFVYNGTTEALSTANLSNPTTVPLLQHVISFNTYGSNVVLYTTLQNAPTGQAAVMLYQNKHSYLLRYVSQSPTYLLDLTQYSGSWYVAAGASLDNLVYVYQNPVNVLAGQSNAVLVPVSVLKIHDPDYLSFSDSAQFIMAENANSFAVYDVQYNENYAYTVNKHFDTLQPNATWMDGDRLDYVSNGKLVVFDYDGSNLQTLMAASPGYVPFFNPIYEYVYALTPAPTTAKSSADMLLTKTALLTPTDI